MQITLAQLVVGFKSAMTIHGLAGHLGVPVEDVRARFRALTPAEETAINTAMEEADMTERPLSLLEQNILTFEGRPHRNAAEYRRGVEENFTHNAEMYETLLRSIVSRQEAHDFAPAAVDRLREAFAQGSRNV
jgi:hypothetical protein